MLLFVSDVFVCKGLTLRIRSNFVQLRCRWLENKVASLEEDKKALALEITNQLKLSIVSRPLTRDEAAMEEDEEDDCREE